MKNMNNNVCPLCSGNDIKTIETVKAKDIQDLYMRLYHVDVLYLFPKEVVNFCKCLACGLKYFTPSAIGDENLYKVLQKTDLYYMEDKEEYAFASRYIKPAHDVLDVGCGKGAFAKRINCNSFTGLELSENAKELAKQYGVNIINQTVQEHALYNKGKYDVVGTFQVLEHVEGGILSDFIKAMVDCIKENGLLIISVPSDDSFVSMGANSALNLPPHHQTHWPDRTLKEIARIYNLDIVNLHHDSLSPRNSDEYLYLNINRMLTKKHPLIRNKTNFNEKISSRLLKLVNRRLKGAIINRIKPNGHSITAVYRKGKL